MGRLQHQAYLPRTFAEVVKYFIFSENRTAMLKDLQRTVSLPPHTPQEGRFQNVAKDLETFHRLLKLTENVQRGVAIAPGSESFKLVCSMLSSDERKALKS